jgi:hypothetical protein
MSSESRQLLVQTSFKGFIFNEKMCDKVDYIIQHLSSWGTGFRDRYLEQIYPIDENAPELVDTIRCYCDVVLCELTEAYASPPVDIHVYNECDIRKQHYHLQRELLQKIETLVFHPIEYRNLTAAIERENEAIAERHKKVCLWDNAICYGQLNDLMIYLKNRVDEQINRYRNSQALLFSDLDKKEKWLAYRFYTEKYIDSLIWDCYFHKI